MYRITTQEVITRIDTRSAAPKEFVGGFLAVIQPGLYLNPEVVRKAILKGSIIKYPTAEPERWFTDANFIAANQDQASIYAGLGDELEVGPDAYKARNQLCSSISHILLVGGLNGFSFDTKGAISASFLRSPSID